MYCWSTSVKHLRNHAQLTQKEIAQVLGISRSKYGRIERNPERCSAKDADKIAEFFDVPVELLFTHLVRRSPFPSKCLLKFILVGTRKLDDNYVVTLEDLKNRGIIEDDELLLGAH